MQLTDQSNYRAVGTLGKGLFGNPWLVAAAVTLATFMEILDTSATNVALPYIAGDLSASVTEGAWVLTSYLAANAVVLPLTSWLSSLFGRKTFYISCVTIFTASSFLCGVAPTLPLLVALRILQGASGGGLQPISQAILMETFPEEKQGTAMSLYGMAAVLAPTIGPTLGGWITDHLSWRWIFFINIPVGIVSVMLTSQLVHDPEYLERKTWRDTRIDYIGLALLASGLAALQILLDKGQEDDWFGSSFIVICALIALIGLVGATIWELLHKEPIVNLRLLRDRSLFLGTVLIFLYGLLLYGSTYLLPLFLQSSMGYTAFLAGMALAPGGFLAATIAMPLAGRLIPKLGTRVLLVAAFGLAAFGLHELARLNLAASFSVVAASWFISRFGLGLVFVPLNIAAFSTTPKERMNQASSLINLSRNIGAAVGISAMTTVLARRSQFHQTVLAAQLTPSNAWFQMVNRSLSQQLHIRGVATADATGRSIAWIYSELQGQASLLSFMDAFWILSTVAAVLIPAALLLRSVKQKKRGKITD